MAKAKKATKTAKAKKQTAEPTFKLPEDLIMMLGASNALTIACRESTLHEMVIGPMASNVHKDFWNYIKKAFPPAGDGREWEANPKTFIVSLAPNQPAK